jgi:dihydroflavonol-4-reductase
MKPVLVTGATGFIGWHVARQLLERGERVRALVRDPVRSAKALAELAGSGAGLDVVTGDLRDERSLASAVDGCGTVYHVAADYRLWAPRPEEMYRSNVDGTRSLLAAARKAGVERCVYTSTVGSIGMPKGELGSEETPVALEEMQGPYKRSKFLAEQVARQFAREGFPVVIVNPTAPVGDHDFRPTPTGKIVVDFLRGAMPAYLDTGLNVVYVGDVAAGHLLACERGRMGERYILGGENLTLQQIFGKLEEVTGKHAPTMRIPYAVAYAAGVASTGWAAVTGKEPRAPLDGVRMARKKMWVRLGKAASELGYSACPAVEALRRAAEWFQANGYCEDLATGGRRTA